MAEFLVPNHLFTGEEALTEAVDVLKAMGRRALIVTGKHVGVSKMMNLLKEQLKNNGQEFAIFDGVTGEPTDVMVEEGCLAFTQQNCDFVIGIGGGSPLDAGKVIAKKCNEVLFAAIPTTSGTGSEVTKYTVITNTTTKTKELFAGKEYLPHLAVVDYRMSSDMPQSVTASTGLDALTHAVEAYLSKKATPLTDALAISSIKRIMKYLPVAYQDGTNQEARRELAIAAMEAGICINNSSVTLVHGLSRPIGALFHVPHGISNAMLLTTCMEYCMDGVIDRMAVLARELGVKEQQPEQMAQCFIEALKQLCEVCEVPTLKEYGLDQTKFYEGINQMAKAAMASKSPLNTRKEINESDCLEIYHMLYPKSN